MKILRIGIWLCMGMLAAMSCARDADFEPASGDSSSRYQPGRLPSEETRQVMIMYSAGFNSLSSALSRDLWELEEGFVPGAQSRADHILLVFSRQVQTSYSNPVAPVLYRLYKDREGRVVNDTLYRWNPEDQASDPAVLRKVMTLAREKFPARGYGLVFSSHGAGWIPAKNFATAVPNYLG